MKLTLAEWNDLYLTVSSTNVRHHNADRESDLMARKTRALITLKRLHPDHKE